MIDESASAPDPDSTEPPPPEPRPKRRAKGRARRLLFFGLAAVVIMGLIDVADSAWTFYGKAGPSPGKNVVIDRGSSLGQAAQTLEDEKVIVSDRLFTLGARLHRAGRDLKAGEYEIPEGATMYEIMRLLQSGKIVIRRVTVAEGLSVKQVVALLEAEDALEGPIGTVPPEGTLYPETYHFTLGDGRQAVLDRMQAEMQAALDTEWAARESGLPLDSKEDALILASIVEKETSLPEERPRIAGVFINRLRRGMALQSDPTIVYGITEGLPLGRPIRQSELDRQTGYNTYHFVGLPPTPIANPGIDSIRAVLHPAETDELYFVADGTGGHVFSRTYREHQQNVQKWRRFQRGQ